MVPERDPTGGPAERARLLAGIEPDDAVRHHELIRRVFRAEVEHRRDTGGDDEYFENLYWAAFLLHLVGDVTDVPMMWRAKYLDFDTAIGFDWQFLLGAGAAETLAYLRETGRDDVADDLAELLADGEDFEAWREFRRRYFCP